MYNILVQRVSERLGLSFYEAIKTVEQFYKKGDIEELKIIVGLKGVDENV